MPLSVSPQANRLGRLSELLDRYIHALEDKPLPADPQKRAAIADRDIRTVDIVLRCEERLQAMMAPTRPADHDELSSRREQTERAIAEVERRLNQLLAEGDESGAPRKPE